MKFILILLVCFSKASLYAQDRIYHQNIILKLDREISSYKVGDTLRTFDSSRNMSIEGIFKSVRFNLILDLNYTDNEMIKSIQVNAIILDSNLYWNGLYNYEDKQISKKIVATYTMNKPNGMVTFYLKNRIQLIRTITNENVSDIGFDEENEAPIYYSLKDSLGLRQGKNLAFYATGKLKDMITYRNNLPFGEAVYYYENGLIEKKGEYLGDLLFYETLERKKLVNSDGIDYKLIYPKLDTNDSELKVDLYSFNQYFLKRGKWEYFNENGSLIMIENYKCGVLKRRKIKRRMKT